MHKDYIVLHIDIAIHVHELQLKTFLEERGSFTRGFALFRGACNAGDQRKFQVLKLIRKEVSR